EHLGVTENVTLILHDWGGVIGMGYAARHPHRVRRLVLLNTGAFHMPKAKRFPWALWLARNTRLGAWLILKTTPFCRVAARICTKRSRLPDDVRAGLLAPYDSPANRIAILRFVQSIPLRPGDPGYDVVSETENALAQFRDRPMVICWGMQDFVFDRHFLDEWIRRFPEAELLRFPDCGHYILEDATTEVIDAVKRFLSTHPLCEKRHLG